MDKYNTTIFPIVDITLPSPAAGANINWNPNDTLRLQPIFLSFLFTADANAANRVLDLNITNGAQTYNIASNPGIITANEAITCNFGISMPANDYSAVSSNMFSPLSDSLFISLGDSLQSVVTNIQVGDAITNIYLRAKMWYNY